MELPVEKLWSQGSLQSQTNGNGGIITLILEPVNETFLPKRLTLVEGGSVRIGRMTNKGTTPTETNGYFDSKVLSRNHAEVSYCNNQVYIKDLKSSNGTFINGKRLSAEGKESNLVELRNGDDLEFGVDIVNEPDKKLLYRKVAAKVCISQSGSEIYDIGINGVNGINGYDHHKSILNGHASSKKRGSKAQQTENSLLMMLEAELERARSESRHLTEIGSMLNDATNTFDSRNKRTPSSEKPMDFRSHEESYAKLEEAENKLRETEAKLNEAVCSQKDYKEKFMASDKKVIELKEKYIASEKKVIELEQKYTLLEKISNERAIQLEQKCKESNQKIMDLEQQCKMSESKIKSLEESLGTKNSQTETCDSDLEEKLTKITDELSNTQYFLEDTREQLRRTEKDLNTSQRKCREFQAYAAKYNDAMKTIEELRSVKESFGNFENRDEAIEKFDRERNALLSRIQQFEGMAKKNDIESTILREQLKKIESLNKSLKIELDKERELSKSLQDQFEEKVKEEVLRLNSQEGLWRRHKKQESEPVKECVMTNERGGLENIISDDKNFKFQFENSLFIKGSIGIVVLGIGAWCLSKLYP